MESPLEITHQPLQSFAAAPGGREMIGNHARVAKIQQKSRLIRGETQKVLIVVVDDFHQVCKQHPTVVGRNRGLTMGKAGIRDCCCCPFGHREPIC